MRFEELCKPVAADNFAGNPDITLEPAFQELQVAIEGKPGSQMGDAIIPDQPPEFKRALALSVELLGQSKHIALLVSLVQSATGLEGLRGLSDSLEVFSTLAEKSWPELYPIIDDDDPDDPWWERLALLRELTDSPAMPDALYRAIIVEVRHIGAFSLRDIDIANGRISANEEDTARCNGSLIQGAFTETAVDDLLVMNGAVDRALGCLQHLEQQLSEKTGETISLAAVTKQVEACGAALKEYAGDRLLVPASNGAEEDEHVALTSVVAVGKTITGKYTSRDDVIEAFNSVIRFYQDNEPSSPVPTLLFRARQMVHKNFFDVLRDLAPQHQDNFREIMKTLNVDPLGTLMEHSYNSFLNGETFKVEDAPEVEAIIESEPVAESVQDSKTEPESELEVDAPDTDEATDEAEPIADDPSESTVQEQDPVSVEALTAQSSNTSTAPTVNRIARVENRDQVLATLTDIQTYFEKNEPSSPVPLVVRKVKTLVPKNFLDLLAEFDIESDSDD